MKRLLLILALFCPQAHAAYAYRYTITVDASQAGATDSSNFTILVNIASDANLATVANGGKIQNTVSFNGQTVPADLGVFTDSTCTTAVTGVDEASYTASTGALQFRFGPVTLSHTTNGTYYLCFGDVTKSAYQGGSVGAAYGTAITGVWHMEDGGTASSLDSSSGTQTGTNTSVSSVAGQIVNGDSYNGTTSFVSVPSSASNDFSGSNAFTNTIWSKTTSTGSLISLSKIPSGCVAQGYVIGYNGNASGDVYVGPSCAWFLYTSSSLAINDGNWHQIVTTNDGSGTQAGWKLYTDGVNRSVTLAGSFSNPSASGASLFFGKGGYSGSCCFFPGSLDEVRIANVARSADWITATYNMEKTSQTMVTIGSLTGLVGPRGAQVAELAGPKLRGLH